LGIIDLSKIVKTPLKRISMDAGDVLHGIRSDDVGFVSFGETYFTFVNQGSVKAWKRHLRMTLNLVVPIGEVMFVFHDAEGDFKKLIIGRSEYARLTVPPGIWFGFKGLDKENLVTNIADLVHDPEEVERADLKDILFDWEHQL
jgi:dTDP-4-dehydrorhamnose 3,5-epimerase